MERDICGSYRWYNRPLQFYIRDLREVITISLHYEGRQNALSQFPQSMKWFSERQGLDNKFGVANNRSLFRCGVCEDLRLGPLNSLGKWDNFVLFLTMFPNTPYEKRVGN
ncbi:hypothetical protein TESG_08259 [Trichophyton tonsurans CBS 112818]|uniref:Uncharacterized protein n=1 Tax=Trichophyton tonsurans (strain CBS 112818) TaxID=647933 RepID=F2RNU2_TRIT1|nr:hypothetical protein TESG_08259 [Trichophyton tonsurans CBS 112818]